MADNHPQQSDQDSDTFFGPWLRRRRRELDLTQSQLAQQVGCVADTVRKLEAGMRRPSRAMAERLALCLSVSAEERAAFLDAARAGRAPCDHGQAPTRTAATTAVALVEPTLLETPPRTNRMPAPMTSFIGREWEVATISTRLRTPEVRLVTLTGAGGVGKTRLALQIGSALHEAFPNGVWFVNLAPISDPALVISTIAQVLGVREQPGMSVGETLCTALHGQQLLLLIDNFEQVVTAAPELAQLVAGVPGLKLLVTSREALRLSGEHMVVVAPLAVADPALALAAEELAHYAAAQLFVARAQAASGHFYLTDANAPAVAAICARLDGLPLAIELAAAWAPLFPPAALLARLEQRLPMLTHGPRDVPARQQTLRNTITWSYDLLTEAEQVLFRQLSVFVGGCTIAAAEAVCGESGVLANGVVDGLASLIEKSLLRQAALDGDESRVVMLETIREYALERLTTSSEAESIRQRHAHYYLALTERAEPELRGSQQLPWLVRLEAEHNNLRAALGWSLEWGKEAVGLQLVSILWRFWEVRGHFSEGRGWLDGVLTRTSRRTLTLAQALYGAGILAWYQSDYARATELYEQSLTVCRELGDKAGIVQALERIGLVASDQGHYVQAITTFEETLALFRDLDNKHGIASSLCYMGDVLRAQGDYERAQSLFKESLALNRELKDKLGTAVSLSSMGEVLRAQGDYQRAQTHFEESLVLFRELGDKHGIATSLRRVADVERYQGDYERAQTHFEESLALFLELGDKYCGAVAMSGFGRVAYNQGECERATSLCQKSIVVLRDLGVRRDIVASSLSTLGYIALSLTDYPRARALFNESLGLAWEEGDKDGIGRGLAGVAGVAGVLGHLKRAARLWGSQHALREAIGIPISGIERAEYESAVAAARAQLGEEAFATAWAAGRALTLEQAIVEALAPS